MLSEDSAIREYGKGADERINKINQKLLETHRRTRSVSRIVMAVFYIVLLAVSVFLLFNVEIAVYLSHVLIGAVLILGGVTNIVSATISKKEGGYKLYLFSMVLAAASVILGLLFIFLPENTGIVALRVISVLLIIKSLSELFVAFKNRKNGEEKPASPSEG